MNYFPCVSFMSFFICCRNTNVLHGRLFCDIYSLRQAIGKDFIYFCGICLVCNMFVFCVYSQELVCNRIYFIYLLNHFL